MMLTAWTHVFHQHMCHECDYMADRIRTQRYERQQKGHMLTSWSLSSMGGPGGELTITQLQTSLKEYSRRL